jgi:hypothetical protein
MRTKPLSVIWKTLLLGAAAACLASATEPQVRVPLYLWWNDIDDNLTSIRTTAAGYRQVRVEARVLKTAWPGTIPLKMFFHPQRHDSFITATPESEQAAINAGYTLVKRDEGYIFQGPIPGTVPLKLYWHSGRQDFATVASAQGQIDQEKSGYSFVRIEGYVFAADDPDFGAKTLVLQTYLNPNVPKDETAYKTSFVVHEDLGGTGCRYSWIGTVFDQHPHNVVLTICDTGVIGRAEVNGSLYEIDPKRMTKAAVFNNQTPPSKLSPTHGKTIDIAIGYTRRVFEKYQARANALSAPMTAGAFAKAHPQLAVDHLNAVLGASGIPATMRLVRTHYFNAMYEESFSSVTDALERVAPRGAAFCDGGDDPYSVKEIRNRTGADLFSLWVDDSIRGGGTGVAYYSESRYYCDQVNAFSVVKAGSALGMNLTFAHEIGHNLGAGHAAAEPQDDSYAFEPSYAHGHTDRDGGFRTIMAYGNACGEDKERLCPKVPYFSSPRIKIDAAFKAWNLTGRPAGSSGAANNARRILEESGPVSAYRSLGCTGSGFGCSSGTPGGGGSDGGIDDGGPVVKN